ncbi:transcriptional regulator [Microtetraspora sp. NBRC 13810]|uniref:DUF397 domain-containing protein n=1 Tax=Microtetraspora sp. NBRC 13810 TaxID=3030990 RepID=UPI00249FD097|nr:DUF397 domain-containing protein [Microtetraspora sp. NBRC 13810]GLW09667.1 transcriptional regulator [Microtetraspora sp. NBRC 13810]
MTNIDELSDAVWRKSARSNNGGNCVEIAELSSGRIGMRDSKDPHGTALIFTSGEWQTFVAGIKAGQFDWT